MKVPILLPNIFDYPFTYESGKIDLKQGDYVIIPAITFLAAANSVKYLNAKILGPVSAPIYKIKKNFRFRLLIRSKKNVQIQKDLSLSLKNFRFSIGIKLTVDVDPISFN